MAIKLCTKCKNKERLSYNSWCKDCSSEYSRKRWQNFSEEEKENIRVYQRKWHNANKDSVSKRVRFRKYGLLDENYTELKISQNLKCKICKYIYDLVVDHDHLTGKARALLCHKCNTMLGLADDNPEILRQAIEYLEEHNDS